MGIDVVPFYTHYTENKCTNFGGRSNVDLYFRDMELNPENPERVRNAKELTVLDVGNFTILR